MGGSSWESPLLPSKARGLPQCRRWAQTGYLFCYSRIFSSSKVVSSQIKSAYYVRGCKLLHYLAYNKKFSDDEVPNWQHTCRALSVHRTRHRTSNFEPVYWQIIQHNTDNNNRTEARTRRTHHDLQLSSSISIDNNRSNLLKTYISITIITTTCRGEMLRRIGVRLFNRTTNAFWGQTTHNSLSTCTSFVLVCPHFFHNRGWFHPKLNTPI